MAGFSKMSSFSGGGRYDRPVRASVTSGAVALLLVGAVFCPSFTSSALASDDADVLVDAAYNAPASQYLELLAGRDPTAATSDGRTPLKIAVFQERLEIVELLIEAGVDVTAPDPIGGRTVLGDAVNIARRGDTRLADLIMAHGGRVSHEPDPGFVLKQARSSGKPAFFARVLETAHGLDNAVFEDAFVDAVESRAIDELSALIAHGAQPTPPAMVQAVLRLGWERGEDILGMLIAAGGRLDFADPEAIDRLRRAMRDGQDNDLLLPLIEGGRNLTPDALDSLLAEAALNGLTLLVDALLEKGARADQRLDEARIVPFSVLRQSAPMSSGENVSDVPLLSAVLGQNVPLPIVALLLEHGADVNALDGLGRPPTAYALLRWFRRERDMGAIKLLLARGAEIMEMTPDEDDPVRISMRAGGAEPVMELVRALPCISAPLKHALTEDVARRQPEMQPLIAELKGC